MKVWSSMFSATYLIVFGIDDEGMYTFKNTLSCNLCMPVNGIEYRRQVLRNS